MCLLCRMYTHQFPVVMVSINFHFFVGGGGGGLHVAGMSDLRRRYSGNIGVYTFRKELVRSLSYKNIYNYTGENCITK